MAKIEIECSQCGHAARVPETFRGRKVRCLRCKAKLRVPEDAPLAKKRPKRSGSGSRVDPYRNRSSSTGAGGPLPEGATRLGGGAAGPSTRTRTQAQNVLRELLHEYDHAIESIPRGFDIDLRGVAFGLARTLVEEMLLCDAIRDVKLAGGTGECRMIVTLQGYKFDPDDSFADEEDDTEVFQRGPADLGGLALDLFDDLAPAGGPGGPGGSGGGVSFDDWDDPSDSGDIDLGRDSLGGDSWGGPGRQRLSDLGSTDPAADGLSGFGESFGGDGFGDSLDEPAPAFDKDPDTLPGRPSPFASDSQRRGVGGPVGELPAGSSGLAPPSDSRNLPPMGRSEADWSPRGLDDSSEFEPDLEDDSAWSSLTGDEGEPGTDPHGPGGQPQQLPESHMASVFNDGSQPAMVDPEAPPDAEQLYQRGLALMADGEAREAVLVLEEAVRFDRHHAPAVEALGRAYASAGDFHRSRRAFRHLTTLVPERADFLVYYAAAAVQTERLEESRQALKTAIQLDPHCAPAYRYAAQLYRRLGDMETAQRFWTRYQALTARPPA